MKYFDILKEENAKNGLGSREGKWKKIIFLGLTSFNQVFLLKNAYI